MSTNPIILHPTDFSEPAVHAFQLAGFLAHSQGANLVVLHVADPLKDSAHPDQGGLPLDKQRQQLEELRPNADGVSVERRLGTGDPAAEILQVARETGCTLIVMGTQGRRGFERLLMGSVAEQVVRNAPCPVVTVKEPAHEPALAATGPSGGVAPSPAAAPIHTILHPTDFSGPCEEAFRVACALAKDQSARVVVVHVAVPPAASPPHMPVPMPLPEDHHGKLEEMLDRFRATAPDVQVDFRLADGDAVAGIVDAAQATDCDLIVMGTHGRSGFGRALMGSVAERVLRTAPCPVVTVKA
jgi:nucleotide-binding universal stress UspA family protein